MITMTSTETAQAAVGDMSSATDGNTVPTATAYDDDDDNDDDDDENSTEPPHEVTNGGKSASVLTTKSDLHFELSLQVRAEGNGGARSTCGVALGHHYRHGSKHSQLVVEDVQALAKCLMTEFTGKMQDRICSGDCIVERLADEAAVEGWEWEWDSG